MDKLADKLSEILTTLQGPGFQVAREAAQVEAYQALTAGGFCAAIAAAIAAGIYWMQKKEMLDGDSRFIITMIGAVIGIALLSIAIWTFIDPWVWATLSQPELWLAKRALKL